MREPDRRPHQARRAARLGGFVQPALLWRRPVLSRQGHDAGGSTRHRLTGPEGVDESADDEFSRELDQLVRCQKQTSARDGARQLWTDDRVASCAAMRTMASRKPILIVGAGRETVSRSHVLFG